jgi:hypothetical protein
LLQFSPQIEEMESFAARVIRRPEQRHGNGIR